MKKILALILSFCFLTDSVKAVTFNEDFSEGIPTNSWGIFHNDAEGAPWTVTSSDSNGWLQISKIADSDSLNTPTERFAGIQSLFQLVGDFSVCVDFNLVDFPEPNSAGWNEAILNVLPPDSVSPRFSVLRFTNSVESLKQLVEGWVHYPSGIARQIGPTPDSTLQGSFCITRSGETLSAWIDRGAGPVFLGSETSTELAVPMSVMVYAAQVPNPPSFRPSTSLDVRFGNLTISADAIVPEPSTIFLLGVCVLSLLGYTWRQRRCLSCD